MSTDPRRIASAVVCALVLSSPAATGAPTVEDPTLRIPLACREFAYRPGGASSPAAWNQLLSLTACMQDSGRETLDEALDCPGYVAYLEDKLKPVVTVYLSALQLGPGPIQLRAAYQIGMAHVGLIVRARSSIVAPPDPGSSSREALHYRALHTALEPALERAAAIAMVSFSAVDQAVTLDPQLDADAVTAFMVRDARAQLVYLRNRWPDLRVPGAMIFVAQ